jgi:hypothetical protein
MSQFLRNMPACYFKPLGRQFVQHYNAKYNANWGPEMEDCTMAYMVYCAVGGHNNFGHPGFARMTAPALQVKVHQ